MKGIILSGGLGTRLYPLTKITSKQLLPIYNKPMVFYPLEKLLAAGITDILFIVAPEHCGDYMRLLGSGKDFGAKFTYEIQDKPEGIAQALIIGKNFIDTDSVALMLGDNIFEDDFSDAVRNFTSGAKIFAKEVADPERFGVVVLDAEGKPTRIVEKPVQFVSNLAIPGFYLYDNRVVDVAQNLKPSSRGELEVTDLHQWYLVRSELEVVKITSEWIDAGTFESLHRAHLWAYAKAHQGDEGNTGTAHQVARVQMGEESYVISWDLKLQKK